MANQNVVENSAFPTSFFIGDNETHEFVVLAHIVSVSIKKKDEDFVVEVKTVSGEALYTRSMGYSEASDVLFRISSSLTDFYHKFSADD